MTLRLLAAFFVFAIYSPCATSTAWEITGFSDFLKGRLTGLSLNSDGSLQLGPSLAFRSMLNEPALWTIALGPDQNVYAGSGHQGKVFRIARDGTYSVAWKADQPEVFAVAFDAEGHLYAGTSPNGGLYRIEGSTAREIWHSSAKYIWSIQAAPDGSLYVGTGEQGRIYRIQPDGRSEIYYETGQSNITALAVGPNGHLYAGSEPNGLLYEISGLKQGTILYDSNLPEIRAIAVDPNGVVYAAAMGGAVATRTGTGNSTVTTTSGAVVAASPTVITVTESKPSGLAADDEQSAQKAGAEASRAATSSTATAAGTASTSVVEVSGVEKSAIYRITPDRTVETLRSSKEENVYDILLDGDGLLFSTDNHGRIYRLHGMRTTLLAEPGDGETMRLLKSGSKLIAAMSNPARVDALDMAERGTGHYESQVHDCTTVAHWGHLQWHGTGSGVTFEVRTGNAARPDSTWSAWSGPITQPGAMLIQSPAARFVQWRAEWPAGSAATLNTVALPYLPQNTPPVVHSITVTSIVGTNAAKAAGVSGTGSSSAYSITVTDTGEAPAASSSSTATQNVSKLQSTQTQISWQADDPDGDKLVYSVYFRAEDEHDWQVIRSRMFENTLLLDPDVFADGRYYFRVVASDAPSNAVQYARQTEIVSTPVVIDNTPPLVTLGTPHRNGSTFDIDFKAADKVSSLRLCEYSLDAGFWQPIEAADGVTDSPDEQFHLHLDRLSPGEHLLVFRVYDTANNAGLARVVLR